jgi:transcriptional regulator GlxA family with amidase domain
MCPTFTPDTHQSNIESPSRRAELAHSLIASVDSETVGKLEQWEQPSQAAPAFVFEVEQFCRRNFSRPIGVEDMARVARMSRYHFSRKFGSARGMPPGRYLASLRLDEAKRMLSHGGHTVKEVAEQCGYGDANYFCKVFRRSFGVSPGTLRYGSS